LLFFNKVETNFRNFSASKEYLAQVMFNKAQPSWQKLTKQKCAQNFPLLEFHFLNVIISNTIYLLSFIDSFWREYGFSF